MPRKESKYDISEAWTILDFISVTSYTIFNIMFYYTGLLWNDSKQLQFEYNENDSFCVR